MPYTYSDDVWERSRDEARIILARYARRGQTISYSELADEIQAARFDPASGAFAALLGDVSTQEFGEGRGMLTVLVVHKGGDMKPGKGFFDLAYSLGLTGDEESIWIEQFRFVTDAWRKN